MNNTAKHPTLAADIRLSSYAMVCSSHVTASQMPPLGAPAPQSRVYVCEVHAVVATTSDD
jgi:hypothetical protein